MVKYFIPETKKEVQIGECVRLSKIEEDESTRTETIWKGVLNENNAEELVEMGLLEVSEFDENQYDDEEDEDVTEMIELMSENLQALTEISNALMEKVGRIEDKIEFLRKHIGIVFENRAKKPNEGK